eukprot:scaffold1229_cov60-Phaeocystis_antarctica.AAC.3
MCPSGVAQVPAQVPYAHAHSPLRAVLSEQEPVGTEQTSAVEESTGRDIPATTDAVAGVAHGRTVVPAWNVIFMSLRSSSGGGPNARSHSASPPMFKAVPSLLQEQLRPGAEFRPPIKDDSTLQTALSVAASPGKRKRSRADRMLALGGGLRLVAKQNPRSKKSILIVGPSRGTPLGGREI